MSSGSRRRSLMQLSGNSRASMGRALRSNAASGSKKGRRKTLGVAGGRRSLGGGARRSLGGAGGGGVGGGGGGGGGGAVERGSRRSAGSRRSMSRRSSTYTGGSKLQDPRPIGDKAFHAQNIRSLITYLTSHNYDRSISPKLLSSITVKDFRCIITFLFQQVDPNFEFTEGKFEEEVKLFLKKFGYPFNISTSSLRAVGSPHTWPSLLAALVWIIEFLVYDEMNEEKKQESPEEQSEHVFFQYTQEAYAMFLDGSDELEQYDSDLSNVFETRNAAINEQIEALNAQNTALAKEKEALEGTTNKLVELQAERATYQSDLVKCEEVISAQHKQKARLEEKQQEMEQTKASLKNQIAEAAAQRVELEKLLTQQEYSPWQVQRMHHQQGLLETSLSQLDQQTEQTQKEVWDQEMTICKKLSDVEAHLNEYHEAAVAVQIIPKSARNAGGIDFSLSLNPNANISAGEPMLNVNLDRVVAPAIEQLRARLQEKVMAAQREVRASKQRKNQTEEDCTELSAKVKGLEERLVKLKNTYRSEHDDMSVELKSTVSQVEDVELSLHRLESSRSHSVEASQKALNAVKEEAKATMSAQAAEKQAFNDEMCILMDQVAAHNVQVADILEAIVSKAQAAKAELFGEEQQ